MRRKVTPLLDTYSNARLCDNWVVIFCNGDEPHYRLLTGTSGGYTTGDSWRINSGIVSVEKDDLFYAFKGSSGSVYLCHKDAYCLRRNNAHVWSQLQETHGDKVSIMNEETDWLNLDWKIA